MRFDFRNHALMILFVHTRDDRHELVKKKKSMYNKSGLIEFHIMAMRLKTI